MGGVAARLADAAGLQRYFLRLSVCAGSGRGELLLLVLLLRCTLLGLSCSATLARRLTVKTAVEVESHEKPPDLVRVSRGLLQYFNVRRYPSSPQQGVRLSCCRLRGETFLLNFYLGKASSGASKAANYF